MKCTEVSFFAFVHIENQHCLETNVCCCCCTGGEQIKQQHVLKVTKLWLGLEHVVAVAVDLKMISSKKVIARG